MAYNLNNIATVDPQTAAEKAVSVIGFGYDLTSDIRLSACKAGPKGSGLIELAQTQIKDLVVPGGVVVRGVSASIKCDKGERTRFCSDALSFNQMSEHFNQELSLSGKIPSGLFNAMFGFKGCWQKDTSTTKLLALDGWFISLYTIELARSQITLTDQVKKEVPSSWDSAALAEFIEKFGTHVVVGVKMGGKDVIHTKQLQTSSLQPTEVQKLLKQLADEKFTEEVNGGLVPKADNSSGKPKNGMFKDEQVTADREITQGLTLYGLTEVVNIYASQDTTTGYSKYAYFAESSGLKQILQLHYCFKKGNLIAIDGLKTEESMIWDLNLPFANAVRPAVSHSKNDDILSIHIRRGGLDRGQSHNQWLSTVSQSPNVISMSFVPIASLLSGVRGSGFLSHAINIYLRYKPPIEELSQFLEFQLPRQWAPAYNDLPLGPRRKKKASPSLKFSLMGPKLYVNTVKVDTQNRPVTGIRLYLEGKRSDHLAIHLQHLSTLPMSLQLMDDHSYEPVDEPMERGYFEPVNWSIFSHVCTAPVEYHGARIDDSASIVTKAWFEVKVIGMKKVLFLRLEFSMVASAIIRRSEWAGPTSSSKKSGLISMLSSPFSSVLNQPEKPPAKADLNSAVYPGGPPSPARAPKMSHFVDTKEMARGPEDPPGYWVVTGAKLCVESGMIRVQVKYSLLTIISDESLLI